MALKFAILGLLAEAPMSGFDIVGQFDIGLSVIWPAPQNEVYKILKALESDGAIRVVERGARGRIVYAITPDGRSALARWLAEPADYSMRYEPMLKAVFLQQATPGARRAVAKADLAFAEEQLKILRAMDAKHRAERKGDKRAEARRLIILFYEAMAKWAREVAGA